MLIKIAAVWVLIGTALAGSATPFLIGRDRGKYTKRDYITYVLVQAVPNLIICGRVLGWW